jgi:hypothetical protein
MAKRILADIEAILKRIEEAKPGIPELSRVEVAALKSIVGARTKISPSRIQQEPGYKEAIKNQRQWQQHVKTVISVNEQAFEDEPTPSKKKRPSGNPAGRPRETDWEEEAKTARQWRHAANHMSKADFARKIEMPLDDLDRLLNRVRERQRRQKES